MDLHHETSAPPSTHKKRLKIVYSFSFDTTTLSLCFKGKLFLQTVADRRNHVKRIHHLDLLDEKIEELVHDPTMQNIKDMNRKLGIKDFQLQQNVKEYMKAANFQPA